jgi:hypothetical protein
MQNLTRTAKLASSSNGTAHKTEEGKPAASKHLQAESRLKQSSAQHGYQNDQPTHPSTQAGSHGSWSHSTEQTSRPATAAATGFAAQHKHAGISQFTPTAPQKQQAAAAAENSKITLNCLPCTGKPGVKARGAQHAHVRRTVCLQNQGKSRSAACACAHLQHRTAQRSAATQAGKLHT